MLKCPFSPPCSPATKQQRQIYRSRRSRIATESLGRSLASALSRHSLWCLGWHAHIQPVAASQAPLRPTRVDRRQPQRPRQPPRVTTDLERALRAAAIGCAFKINGCAHNQTCKGLTLLYLSTKQVLGTQRSQPCEAALFCVKQFWKDLFPVLLVP